MRRPFVAGNWKMNLNLAQARELVGGVVSGLHGPGSSLSSASAGAVEVAVCPPFVYLLPMAKATIDTPVRLGAQNLYFEPGGAFTGEVSAAMLVDAGVRYVILGHSERRHTIGHHEDDWMINRKVKAAIAAGLVPILCVGETLDERKAERTNEVLTYQLRADLIGVELASADQLVVAYEPVWAIGTGLNATPAQAQDAHRHLRQELGRAVGDLADDVRILYGGSVKPDNAQEIMAQPDVDGGLIGGASLKADAFLGIIRATATAKRSG